MAKFNFQNLDSKTRQLMLSEINSDIEQYRLYLSDRLNSTGRDNYVTYLIKSVMEGDESMLESMLDINTHFNPTYLRQGNPVKMPSNASTLLSQSEFNRYYIRAICLRAVNTGIEAVQIYRARESSWTRPESEAKIGSLISSAELLEDLRNSIGTEPKLFPDINSGLSVKL
ncbi:hypothetical protein [Algoriphagus pacificus]|uniref:Ferritin-like metal-binding protein YciE n=1 Tax=Algoriphagus pacificus TaxID=2811234 RepID=A0ABS3CGL3_9BACT|nr:hypothetical protein [Algoriphagus pacificus]MBN7816247.1 hypothetical protein [Algoriphagus pacificus]